MEQPIDSPNILGTAPISRLFFKYYKPTLISLLSIMLHQVINGIILGQKVGKAGIGAVGLYAPVVIVLIALTLPVMIGGGILIGKYIGAGTYAKAQYIFQFATTLALIFGGVIALSTPFITKPIADFLAGKQNIELSHNLYDYIFWQFINMPFFILRMFWGNFLSNDGAPKASRNGNLIAVGINILLDLVLVAGLGMGVKGASIATAIAIFAACTYLYLYVQKHKGHIGFQNFRFTARIKEWKEFINFGLPTFVSEISFALGLVIINQNILPYGAAVVAAFGMVNFVSFIFLRMITAAMLACLPIMSYNIGAKLPERVLAVVRFSISFTLILGITISCVGYLVPGLLIRLFSQSDTAEFRQIAINSMSLYFLLFLAAGPNFILSAYFQSIKKTGISILINVLKSSVFIWLFAAILPGYFKMGLNGIWLSRSFAEITTLLLLISFTFLKKKEYYSLQAIASVN